MFDGELFGQQMVEIVRSYMEAELASLKAENDTLRSRIEALEGRSPEKGEPGEAGPQGEPGTVDMGAVKALVDDAVSALPVPAPGKDGADGAPGEKGDPGLDGAPGKDGVGLADALIDKDGSLVLTMTDGRTKALGLVVGKDGLPGRDGSDGKDGETFTLDDFDIEPIGERAFKFKFTKGEVCHAFEFAFPVVLDRGVFSAGKQYEAGDAVTWGGSLWIAQKDTDAKPDTPGSGWRLAVKRGRDGRDAK